MDPMFPLAAAALGAAVGVILRFGRDPKADEHDLSDYHEPTRETFARRWLDANEQGRNKVMVLGEGVTITPVAEYDWSFADDDLPPAPEGMNAGSPLWRAVVIDTAVPTLTDEQVRAKADEWLREIRDGVAA